MVSAPRSGLSSLITTKLVPPRRTGALAREHLVSRLVDARRKRCIVLQGGAGAGKTSVLVTWQQALTPLGFEVAWLSLSPDDDEAARFVDYLLASLGQLDPAIVREATLLTGTGADRETIERIVIALVQGLAAYGREVMLVIDDLHFVTDPLILDCALQFLLEFGPANFHLALASRRAIPLALGRLHAEGQLLEVDAQALRFSPAETRQFLQAQLGTVDARDAARLHSLSDGWPAGLQLLALNLRHAQPSDTPRPLPIHDAGGFAAYFEREVLERLAPGDAEKLVRLSACARFCARLTGALIAPPGVAAAPVEASRLIARLENENLFIVPVDSADRERWYRLHPLLREVLLTHLHALAPEDQQALHARAANWFEDEGLIDEAVRHRLDAGQDEAAATLVERCAEDLQLRGDYRALASILRRLPMPLIERRLSLRFLLAGVYLRTRELDACARTLDALDRDIPPDQGLDRFRLAVSRAGLHVQRDDTAAAGTLLEQLEDLPPGVDGWLIGSQKNLLSLIHLHEGRYEKARRVQEEGPPRLVQGEPLIGGSQGLLTGRCFVGLSHALEGNMLLAERCYRDVLREADLDAGDRREAGFLATALLGEVLYERSELRAALELLEPRLDLLERSSIPDTVLRVMVVLSRAHALLGHQLESLAYLERLEDYASALGLDRLLGVALHQQLYRRLRAMQFAEADALLARLDTLAARHADSQGALGELQLTASAGHAVRALAHGELEAAAARLSGTIALCEARGQIRRVARLRLLAAVIEQRCGRSGTAQAWALEALTMGHRLGLVRSLLDAHPDAVELVRSLRAGTSLDPVLMFYADRLLAVPAPLDTAPAAATRHKLDEALSQRETDLLHMLVLALPNKKIARSLGLSIETVKWHLRNVYRKLNVTGRDEAVTRARDLGLVDTPPPR